MFVRLTKAN